MILASPVLLFAVLAFFFLVASSLWAHYRFADFVRLPRQFGINLEPVSYGPRWLIVWIMPFSFGVMAVVCLVLVPWSSLEFTAREPAIGVMISSAVCVVAQGFILWLLTRWANKQA